MISVTVLIIMTITFIIPKGSLDPWFCNGCSGSLGTPAHSGQAAFKVEGRHARLGSCLCLHEIC